MVTFNMKIDLNGWITGNTNSSNSVVELGAGFFSKLTAVHPSVSKKIGIEIWESYIASSDCPECIKIHGDILKFEKLIDKEDMDCCMVIDVLEHFEKDTAIDLVQRIKNNFNKFLLMVPEGNHPQNGDVTGHGADEYQKHRSTWREDDLQKLGFDQIILDENFHPMDDGKDCGCLFAVWIKEEINKKKWDKDHESLNEAGCANDDELYEAVREQNSYVTIGSLGELDPYHNFGTIFNNHLITDKTVLDIGVGRGRLLEHFKGLGNRTIGCDISEVAINLASENCDEVYLSKDLSLIEPVDLAICHLVAQHNHEAEIFRILNEVQLKPGGVLSLQFASLVPEKSQLSPLIMEGINKSMLYFYSADKMKSLVTQSNKKLTEETGPWWFGDPFNFEWHIFRIENEN